MNINPVEILQTLIRFDTTNPPGNETQVMNWARDLLAEAGIEASVGSVGGSYDNALAETINGLYKAEVIHKQSWKNRGAVEPLSR